MEANQLLPKSNYAPSREYPTWSAFFTAPESTARQAIKSPATAFRWTGRSWSFPSRWTAAWRMGLRLIGLVYLAIGIYVLFRRWTAPRATHFYLFCLVSFALYALKYTGSFDTLDWTVFWCNVLAESLQPALFLHFALSFPEERLKNSAAACFFRSSTHPALACSASGSGPSKPVRRPASSSSAQPDRHRLRRRFLHPGCAALPAQLQPRRHASAAPAVEVAHPRNSAGRRALHALLRHSLSA